MTLHNTMPYFRLLYPLSLTLLLTACGFSPVYHTQNSNGDVMAKIQRLSIAEPRNRNEQIFTQCLMNRFGIASKPAQPLYHLGLNMEVGELPSIIEATGEIKRYQVPVTAHLNLQNLTSKQSLNQSTLRQQVGYNISDNDYTTYVASRDAMQQGILEICEQYALRLPILLSK